MLELVCVWTICIQEAILELVRVPTISILDLRS
jgi:hypothetical protein